MWTMQKSTVRIENIDKYKFPTPKDFVIFFGRFGAISSISIEPQSESIQPHAISITANSNHKPSLDAHSATKLDKQFTRENHKQTSSIAMFKGKINYFFEDDAQKAANALNNHLHGKYHLRVYLDKSVQPVFPGFIPAWQRSVDLYIQAAEIVLKNSINIQKEVLEKVHHAIRKGNSLEPLIIFIPTMHDIPSDVRYLIDTTAEYVAKHGVLFEKIISSRERNNMIFGLFISSPWSDDLLPIYDIETLKFRQKCRTYYQWRVYSLMNGDSLSSWKSEPYQSFESGTIFFPPDHETNQSLVAKKPQTNLVLSQEKQQSIITLLRHVMQDRESVGQVSHFILRNYLAISEIGCLLCSSITQEHASDESLLARLYVLNDVLHNSNKWNAEAFDKIRSIIDALKIHVTLICTTIRKRFLLVEDIDVREQMTAKMNAVVDSWRKNNVFSERFIDAL